MRKSIQERTDHRILKKSAAGTSAGDVSRKHGISDATYYKWRSH
jgi:transposase-like protein